MKIDFENIRKVFLKRKILLFSPLAILILLMIAFLLQLPKNADLSQNQRNFSSANLGISFNYPDNMIIYDHTPDSYNYIPLLSLVSKEVPNPKNLYDESNALCVGYKDPEPVFGSKPSVLKGYFMNIRRSFSFSRELREGYERWWQKILVDGHEAYKAEEIFRCGLKLGKAIWIAIPRKDNSMTEISLSYPIGFNNYGSSTDKVFSSIKFTSF